MLKMILVSTTTVLSCGIVIKSFEYLIFRDGQIVHGNDKMTSYSLYHFKYN